MAEELGTQPTRQPSALDIAAQWAQLPAEHLAVALSALEPQLAREHEARVRAEQARAHFELEQLRADVAELGRAHRRHLVGVYSAVVVALTTLGASVYFGMHEHPVLAVAFFGPTLMSLVKIFALGRSDANDLKQAAAAAKAAANALTPPPP